MKSFNINCCTLLFAILIAVLVDAQTCSDHATSLHGSITAPSAYNQSSKDQLLFFLHQPRTAGRTLLTCLLRRGYERQGRSLCPRSYDLLRFDASNKCSLLSSHDDYSLVAMIRSKAPSKEVAVMTHIRDPIERFISSYEFAVLNAARTLSKELTKSKQEKQKTPRVLTENVFPWSELIPWFIRDMTERRGFRGSLNKSLPFSWIEIDHPSGHFYYNQHHGISKWSLTDEERSFLLPPLDPYDAPQLVMPLLEFAQHPMARELLHNGQTAAVLGITNYSHMNAKDTGASRQCLNTEEGRPLLQQALDLLGYFAHVGSTGLLEDSVTAAAARLGFDLSFSDSTRGGTLGEAFQACQAQAQSTQSKKRNDYIPANFLPDGRFLAFSTHRRRLSIKKEAIKAIREANQFDFELHTKAIEILEANRQKWSSRIRKLPAAARPKIDSTLYNSKGHIIPLPKAYSV
jgi:hypothetical protein